MQTKENESFVPKQILDLRLTLTNYLERYRKACCNRRAIACVALNLDYQIVGMGYNATYKNHTDRSIYGCTCPGRVIHKGEGGGSWNNRTIECYAIHAEEVAMVEALSNKENIYAIFSTKAPCTSCVLKLLGSHCREIYFLEPSIEKWNQRLWEEDGRKWIPLTEHSEI